MALYYRRTGTYSTRPVTGMKGGDGSLKPAGPAIPLSHTILDRSWYSQIVGAQEHFTEVQKSG